MGKCIIIAPLYGGEAQDWLHKEEDDFLLCADGGYQAAKRFGIKPDLVIGDFDSMPLSDVPNDVPAQVLPTHKDDTDLAVCLAEGRKRGYRTFRIAGCLGGRLDHTIAALQLLQDCASRGEEAVLADARNRITALRPGSYRWIDELPGWKWSLFSADDRAEGVTLRGTEWELTDAVLTNRVPLGVSNEVRGEVILTFTKGILLVCRSQEERTGGKTR